MDLQDRIKAHVRDIPDFPKPGIVFKDITPILAQPRLTTDIMKGLEETLAGIPMDGIACIESRGFWFGTILAHHFQVPMIPIRKKGKLPSDTISVSYDLEYDSATLEAHKDSVVKGHNIVIHDDVLATGGTARATAQLIQQMGGNIAAFVFLVDLSSLHGADKLKSFTRNITSLVKY